MTTARTIKRYANRKLYDTRDSRYVTLDHIAAMVRAGDDVRVVDNTTRADLTTATLTLMVVAIAISFGTSSRRSSLPRTNTIASSTIRFMQA